MHMRSLQPVDGGRRHSHNMDGRSWTASLSHVGGVDFATTLTAESETLREKFQDFFEVSDVFTHSR